MGDVKGLYEQPEKKKPQNRMEEYIKSVEEIQEERKNFGVMLNPQMEQNKLLHQLNLSAALIVDELALLINTVLQKMREENGQNETEN